MVTSYAFEGNIWANFGSILTDPKMPQYKNAGYAATNRKLTDYKF